VELATESIPGCVLQLYVYLTNSEEAVQYALLSIAISALTAGYTSAMISFDFDVSYYRRQKLPKFYGFIPDSHQHRGVCFTLMMLISGLNNLSRSVGCVLLIASSGKSLVVAFIAGEVILYLLYKVIRGDYFWFPRVEGTLAILASLKEFVSR